MREARPLPPPSSRRVSGLVHTLRDAAVLVALGLLLAAAVGMARAAWSHLPAIRHASGRVGVAVPDEAAAAIPTITVALAEHDASVWWIDARSPDAFAHAHIPGAVNCPADLGDAALERIVGLWSPERLIVVYCDSAACDASRMLAEQLRRDLGSDRIRVLDGGWEAWLAAHPRQPSSPGGP
jgi:rhodanese-related sulfurtransferase